jgi:hypothetical protein
VKHDTRLISESGPILLPARLARSHTRVSGPRPSSRAERVALYAVRRRFISRSGLSELREEIERQ